MDQNEVKSVKRKRREGSVIRLSGTQTAAVEVKIAKPHPIYGKVVRRSHTFLVHFDEKKAVSVGDKVVVEETRPISKLKKWRVIEIKGNE